MTTPTHRLLDAVAASQQHDEAVQHAAAVLATDQHPNLAQRLLDTWAAIGGDDPDQDIRALPVEPGVGVTVEVVARAAEGWAPEAARFQHKEPDQPGERRVWQREDGYGFAWPELLSISGPRGVRVLKGGADDA